MARTVIYSVTACLCSVLLLEAMLPQPGIWEVLDECSLSKSSGNDGDHFLVKHKGDVLPFRLYFVDAPELNSASADRIEDQSRYFSISPASVTKAGGSAMRFTQKFLADEFTVITRWEDARDSESPCYLALARKGETYLSSELVKYGHARIHGVPPATQWPCGYNPHDYLKLLKNLERAAQQGGAGIWASAGASPQLAALHEFPISPINDSTHAPTPRAFMEGGKINLNTASAGELTTLPGIGPVLAERIIAMRPLKSVDELVQVSGISPAGVDLFRNRVVVEVPPPPPDTADFYRTDVSNYLNKEVRVIVTSVAQADALNAPGGFRPLHLETGHDGAYGGGITAFVPEEYHDSFINYYSQPGREFKGTLYRHNDEIVLVYRRR